MSQNVPLKSSFRQPVPTLLIILLFGMTSFAFVSKAVEYLVVQRETGRLGSYYRSIGSLTRLDGNASGDVSQGANLILRSPYLAYEDRRKLSTGVMQDIWTPDVWLLGTDNNGMWFYGRLINQQKIVKNGDQETSVGYALTFAVDQVLAGFPDDIRAGSAISMVFLYAGHEDAISKIEAMQIGQGYLIRAWKDINFQPDPGWQPSTANFQMRALDDAGLWYIPVAAGAGVDFTAPGMAGIKNDIDILNENQHTLSLIGTTDMSAMPQMQAASHVFYLADGRWLNHQDDLEGKKVIVIQRQFAADQKLKLGDSITMTLRGLKDPVGPYIQGKDRENWRSYPTYQETFEIVGFYDDMLRMMTYNLAYVPNSVLPADAVNSYTSLYYGSLYSFVLDSSQHQEAFVIQTIIPLGLLGFKVNFVYGNNGTAFWAYVTPLQHTALAGLVIYSVVLLLALLLAISLYLSQRRKDYAILRALGVPKDQANRQASLPILLMGALGVLVGGIPAWGYALEKSAEALSKIPTPAGVLPSATLNSLILSTLGGGLLLLLACFTWVGVRTLAVRPVLELLGRETPGRKTRATSAKPGAKTAATAMPAKPVPVATPPSATSTGLRTQRAAKGRPFNETGALARFGLRQVRRSAAKSSLTALVALGLVVALGWMQWSMDRDRATVDHLYATTVVEAEIGPADASITTSGGDGVIAQRVIDKILASGFIQSAYAEAADNVTAAASLADPATLMSVTYPMTAFDQPEVYLAGLDTRDTFKYLSRWDETLFTKNWTLEDFNRQGVPAVFPDSFLQTFDLKLGDRIYLTEESKTVYPYLVAGQYTPGLWSLSSNIVRGQTASILLPLSALKVIQNNDVYYSIAKFTINPAKNRELPAFEQEMSTMISGSGAGRVPLKIHFWDEELRAVVAPLEKNLSLMQVLYPVTMAVSVLIGAVLCLLLALQQARDTALLRMLGVTKTRVRVLLSGQQLLLSLAGVLVGLGLLGILRQNPGAVLSEPLLLSAGLYLSGALIGSLIGAITVSNKKPLELLQVKE